MIEREIMPIPVITIIGKSGAGKTTLLEKLIAELSARGRAIGTVKHHSHAGFDIDRPGKDSWRHAQAGSQHVVIASPDKIASYRLLEHELELDEITASMTEVDMILVEGYRQSNKPSIEVIRAANSIEMISSPEQRIALVTDASIVADVPTFQLDDYLALADFIEAYVFSIKTI